MTTDTEKWKARARELYDALGLDLIVNIEDEDGCLVVIADALAKAAAEERARLRKILQEELDKLPPTEPFGRWLYEKVLVLIRGEKL